MWHRRRLRPRRRAGRVTGQVRAGPGRPDGCPVHPDPVRNPMKHLVIALSAIAALPLSACGDDSDDSEPLSKSEFVEQADEICAEGDETIDAAQEEFANPDSP